MKATSSGGATSGSGSEGGSNTMNANLVFQADLLIKALIMTELGTGNASAQAIVERWDSMTHDAVYLEGAAQVYTASGYFDAVNTARSSGTYLSFAEYIQEDDAVTTPNRPYAVKQVLEDNLLGEATSFSETASKPVPDLILVQEEGGRYTAVSQVTEVTAPIFLCQDEAYLTALAEQGKLYLNDATYSGAELDEADYAIDQDAGTITLDQEKLGNKLALGANTLTLSVEGYQTAKLTFSYQKALEEVSLNAPAEPIVLGEAVVITCNGHHEDSVCDFLNNLTSVQLTGPDNNTKEIFRHGEESVHRDAGYTCAGMTLTLGKDLFEDKWSDAPAGTYTLTLSAAYGYGKQTVTFMMKEKEEKPAPGPEDPSISVPTTAPRIEKKTNYSGNTYYELKFDEADQAWVSKVSGIVRDSTTEYSFEDSLDDVGFGNTCYLDEANNSIAMAFPSDFSDGTYTIVISSDQSADLILEVTIPGLFGGSLSVTIKTADS